MKSGLLPKHSPILQFSYYCFKPSLINFCLGKLGNEGLEISPDFAAHQHVHILGACTPKRLNQRTEIHVWQCFQDYIQMEKMNVQITVETVHTSCLFIPQNPRLKQFLEHTESQIHLQVNLAGWHHRWTWLSLCCSLFPSTASDTMPAGLKMLQWYFLGEVPFDVLKEITY